MKSFRSQYCECYREKFVGKGEIQKFKDHPELLPHPILSHKVAQKIAKELEKNPDFGFKETICLRFKNGPCSSSNLCCKELRKVEV